MPDQMPPPGPERDAEIAKLLGDPWSRFHDFSDARTADRLVEEMAQRGWLTQTNVFRYASGAIGHSASVHRGFSRGEMIDPVTKVGTTRPDAVSAAALLALRATR